MTQQCDWCSEDYDDEDSIHAPYCSEECEMEAWSQEESE